jgi:protein TonB
LQAIILKDGSVGSIKLLKSAGNTTLDEAGIASVRQWQYSPTLLNGEPVEVLTTVEIAFQLEQ